ncbi:MAG: hypothetical protein WC054_00160 [Candidatus Nanopelagicales bacterium]
MTAFDDLKVAVSRSRLVGEAAERVLDALKMSQVSLTPSPDIPDVTLPVTALVQLLDYSRREALTNQPDLEPLRSWWTAHAEGVQTMWRSREWASLHIVLSDLLFPPGKDIPE